MKINSTTNALSEHDFSRAAHAGRSTRLQPLRAFFPCPHSTREFRACSARAHRANVGSRRRNNFGYDVNHYHVCNFKLAGIYGGIATCARGGGGVRGRCGGGSVCCFARPSAYARLRRYRARIVRSGIHPGADFGGARNSRQTFRRGSLHRIFPADGSRSWFRAGYLFPPRSAARVEGLLHKSVARIRGIFRTWHVNIKLIAFPKFFRGGSGHGRADFVIFGDGAAQRFIEIETQAKRILLGAKIEIENDRGEPASANPIDQLAIGNHSAARQQLALKKIGEGSIESSLHQIASTETERPRVRGESSLKERLQRGVLLECGGRRSAGRVPLARQQRETEQKKHFDGGRSLLAASDEQCSCQRADERVRFVEIID